MQYRFSKFILCVAFIAMDFLSHSLSLAQDYPCLPISDPPNSLEGLTLRPGKYILTLMSTSGVKNGAVVNGDLILITASKQDFSPQTGERACINENLADTPFYGTVNIDFDSVAAPVFELSGRADPIYPDALVRLIDFKGIKRQPVVVIGSAGSRRDGVRMLDGTGIGLFVQRIGDEEFAGIWGNWGVVRGGSGYFCARLVTRE